MQMLRRISRDSGAGDDGEQRRASAMSNGEARRISIASGASAESKRSRDSGDTAGSQQSQPFSQTDSVLRKANDWRTSLMDMLPGRRNSKDLSACGEVQNSQEQGRRSSKCESPSLVEDSAEDLADRRKFANLVADKVVSQLRGSIKTSITSVVGQAIDAAIAERLVQAACAGAPLSPVMAQLGSPDHNSKPPTSEDICIGFNSNSNRVPTWGTNGDNGIGLAFEGASSNSVTSSFSSDVYIRDLPERKKPAQSIQRRRNSIGTMERMLAENLFEANVHKIGQDRDAKKVPRLDEERRGGNTDKADASHRKEARKVEDEEFSSVLAGDRKMSKPKADDGRSVDRHDGQGSAKKPTDLQDRAKRCIEAIQQEARPKETAARKPEAYINVSNDSGFLQSGQKNDEDGPSDAETECKEDKGSDEVIDSFDPSLVPGGMAPDLSQQSPGKSLKKKNDLQGDVMKSMRQAHEHELMEEFRSRKSQEMQVDLQMSAAFSLDDSDLDSEYNREKGLLSAVASPKWLQVCGILPQNRTGCFLAGQGMLAVYARLGSRTWYQLLVRVLVTLSLVFMVYEAIALTAEIDTFAGRDDLSAQLMSDIPLALGSLLGLLFSDALHKNNIIGSNDSLLVCFCWQEGLLPRWAKYSRLAYFEMLFLWICMVGERVRSSIAMEVDVIHTILHVVGFAIVTGVLMGLAYSALHVCRALAIMTDNFCHGFAECPACDEAVRNWNVLQAALRKVSHSVESVFIVMLTAALVAVCLPLLRHGLSDGIQSLLAVVPALLVLFSVSRISFRAGAVTYKCDRVPALINSLTFGKEIDHERQYVINYILHSLAGFYVFEVRITAEMVLKFAYAGGAIVFGVLTQLLS